MQFRIEHRGWTRYSVYFLAFLLSALGLFLVALPGHAFPEKSASPQWQVAYTGQHHWLKEVQFINPQLGYAVGESKTPLWYGDNPRYRGSILRTTDGGRTWEEMYRQPSHEFELRAMKGIHMISAYEGWAVGDLGRILHTKDGWNTWEVQPSGHSKPQFDVFISPDGQYGWIGVSQNAGHMLRTTNGGRTWISGMGNPAPWGAAPESMDWIFANGRWYGFAIGSVSTGGLFVRSSDGGISWARPYPDLADVHVHQVDFVDIYHGWVAADYGRIYYTVDGGNTWRYAQVDKNVHVMAVQFLDSRHGYAVGARCPSPPNYWFQCTDRNGHRISAQVVFLTTQDGGRSWRQENLPGVGVPVDLFVLDPNHIWIVGEQGMVLRYSGGDALPTYEPLPSPTSTPTPTITPTPTPTPTPTALVGEGTLVLQEGVNGYDGVEDAYINRWWPHGYQNFGRDTIISIRGEDRYGVTLEGLLRFDLSILPSYATIRRAYVELYSGAVNNSAKGIIRTYMLRRAWEEDVVTFYTASRAEPWQKPGALGAEDRDPVPISETVVEGTHRWFRFDVTKAVQAWLRGDAPNYGVILQGFVYPGNPAVHHNFISSEDRHVDLRPRLVIEYRIATPTPTPTPTPTHTFTPTPTPTPMPQYTPTPTPVLYNPPVVLHLQEGRDGYLGTQDTYISRWFRTQNFGMAPYLAVRTKDSYGPTHEALLYFPIPQLPENARLMHATLKLYSGSRSRKAPIRLKVYMLKRPWREREATWLLASGEAAWEQPGAFGERDRAQTPVGETLFDDVYTWVSIDVTDAVRAWLRDPSTNYGLIVQGFSTGVQVQHNFLSNQYPAVALRPILEIAYQVPRDRNEEPTSTPTPAMPTATPTPVPPTPTPTPTPTATATPFYWSQPITVKLQEGVNGYRGVTDTYISRWYRTHNFGQAPYLAVRTEDAYGVTHETLLRFPLRGMVPPQARIVRAALRLYSGSRSRGTPIDLRVYMLRRPWEEQAATWERATSQTRWEQAGALGRGDRYTNPVGSTRFDATYTWVEIDVTSAVKEWLLGLAPNYGLIVQGFSPSGVQVQHNFLSSQYPAPSLRPVLEIVYQLPTTTPPAWTPSPTPTRAAQPTSTPRPTWTPWPPGPTPTPIPTRIIVPGTTRWVGVRHPGVYLAYDYSGHNPRVFGTAGSLAVFHWADLEGREGEYTFGLLDSWLSKLQAYGLKGGFFVSVFEGGCNGDRALPAYIRNDPSAVIRRNLGTRCPTSGRTWKAVPNYLSPRFQERYHALIRALGAHFKEDPRLEFVAIGTGLYGETRAAGESADLALLQKAGLNSQRWVEYVNRVTDWYFDAFSDGQGHLLKALLQQSAPVTFNAWERREINKHAVELGIGISLNLMYPDGEGVLYKDNPSCPMCSWYDFPLVYWEQIPTAWEAYEMQTCTTEQVWWGVYNVLNKHPVYLRVAWPLVRSKDGSPRREFLEPFRWAASYLGVTAKTAPSAWVALREHRDPWRPYTCMGSQATVRHQNPQWGNYGFFMTQKDGLPGGRTVPETNDATVSRMGQNAHPYNPSLPPGKEAWAIRRTDQATGNRYMFFDVDQAYLSGIGTATVSVTYWDHGRDTWALYYRNAQGQVVRAGVVEKKNTNGWRTVTFQLPNARWNESLPEGTGGADFYIDCNNDGDEWIHFVEVRR